MGSWWDPVSVFACFTSFLGSTDRFHGVGSEWDPVGFWCLRLHGLECFQLGMGESHGMVALGGIRVGSWWDPGGMLRGFV